MMRLKQLVAVVCVAAIASPVFSAEESIQRKEGANVSTSVDVGMRYDSNLYLQDDNETDTVGFVLEPGVDWTYIWGTSEIYARYLGELVEYDATSVDDYFDNYFALGYDIDLTNRHHFKGEAAYYKDHTPFGFERTENTPRQERELDKYDVTQLKGEYLFGATDAKINVGVYGEYRERDYKSNRTETFFLDRTTRIIGGRAIFNYSKRTFFLLDVEGRDIEFVAATPGFTKRDATEERVLLGVRWFATGKTIGTVRIGHMERDQEADVRKDFSGIDWDIVVAWSPTRRDTITFESERTTRESFEEVSDFINTQSFGIDWDHQWTPRFKTMVGFAIFEADFDGVDRPILAGRGDTRTDDLSRFEMVGTYLMTRNLTLEFGYENRQRDTNLPGLDYNRNIVNLGLQARY